MEEAFEAQSLSLEEKQLIAIYRKIPKSERKLTKGLLDEFGEKNHNKAVKFTPALRACAGQIRLRSICLLPRRYKPNQSV